MYLLLVIYINLVLHLVLSAVVLKACTRSQQQILTMAATQYETDLDLVPEDSPKTYKVGTIRDQHDMRRVGKTQELRVGGGRCGSIVQNSEDFFTA